MFKPFLATLLLSVASVFAAPPPTTQPAKVAFDPDGILTVNQKRFFPIGIYLYELTPTVMAELHDHRFNTVIGNGFSADQFDFLHQHGMMAVPFSTPENIAKVKDHPALLAWYLVDERVGDGWMIIAVNVLPKFFDVMISADDLGNNELRLPYENRTVQSSNGKLTDRFAPFEAKVYLAGPEPREEGK